MAGASSDTAPCNTNTHNHFATTPVGLIKFKQVAGKKIMSHKQSSTYTKSARIKQGKMQKRQKGPPAHVTIP